MLNKLGETFLQKVAQALPSKESVASPDPEAAAQPALDQTGISDQANERFDLYNPLIQRLQEARAGNRESEQRLQNLGSLGSLFWGGLAGLKALSERNSSRALTESQQSFCSTLNEAQQQAFRAMDEPTRVSFQHVHEALKGDPQVKQALEGMLQGQAFELPQFQSMLRTISQAVDRELCPALKEKGVDKHELLGSMIKEVADPIRVYQGKNTPTCAPSSLQSILAATQPDKYAELVTDLMTKGKHPLPGIGESEDFNGRRVFNKTRAVELSTVALDKEDGGRCDLDDLVQDSLLRYGQELSPEGDAYGGRGRSGGTFRGRSVRSGGTFRGDSDEAGLTPNQIQQMFVNLTGDQPSTSYGVGDGEGHSLAFFGNLPVVSINGSPLPTDQAIGELAKHLKEGRFVPVGLNFDGERHVVTLAGIGQEKVSVVDPIDHRLHEIPLEQFKGMLEMAILTAPPAPVQDSGGG